MPKIAFIVNPRAAGGGAGRTWPRIEALARDRLGTFATYLTSAPGDAMRLVRQAVKDGADVVVCVGGDGTLNEVVNGLMVVEGASRGVAVGFVPRSTGCDLIRSVRIARQPEKALDIIKEGHVHLIDLGRIRYLDGGRVPRYRYFHNIASFGLGGEVDERVNRTSKVFGGFISFMVATLMALLKYDKKRIYLQIDESFAEELLVWNVAVANGQYHGGGMWVAPGAKVDDGLLQVTVIGDLSLPEVFWNLPRLYNGKIYEVMKVRSFAGRLVEASSPQKVLLDVDGEQVGGLPVLIEVVPQALPLITAAPPS